MIHSKRIKQLYIFTLSVVGMALLLAMAFLLSLDRNQLISHIITLTNKPYLLNLLTNKIITPQKFLVLRYLLFASIIIDVVLVALLYRLRSKVLSLLQFIISTTTSCIQSLSFKSNSKTQNILLFTTFSIILIKGIFYILKFNLQYDEMWSYNYFTSRPFYLIFFSYNNYPLYELCTHISKWLPFSMKVNLRLPPFIIGLCCMVVIFSCTKKCTSHFFTALSAMVLFACMPVTVFYMLYARGVMFELFFAITAFFSILFLHSTGQIKKYSFLYIASNVLGMYSMPTHLYFWLVLSLVSFIYFIVYEKSNIKPFLLSNILILTLSIFCYFPVLCGSGLSFIFDAPYSNIPSTNTLANIIFYSKGISNFFTGSYYGLMGLFLFTLSLLILYKKISRNNIFLLILAILLCLLPAIIFLTQHTFVPERALAFIGLVIPLLGSMIFYTTKNTFNQYQHYTLLFAAFVGGSYISHWHGYLNWSVEKDKTAIIISDLFLQEKIESCYDNSPSSDFSYFYPALEYYFSQHKKTITLNMAATNSQRYKPLLDKDNFDCVIDSISANETVRTLKYKKIYTDQSDGFKVWRLK